MARLNGKPIVDGSAVLIELNNRHYLITADHVGIQKGDMRIDVGSTLMQSDLGRFISFSNIDITVVEILNPSPFVEIDSLNFVQEDEIGIDHLPERETSHPCYLISGYPRSKAKQMWGNSERLAAHPFGFRTRAMSIEEQQSYPFEPSTHLLVRFSREKLVNGKTMVRHNPPQLQGISGSGLWYQKSNSLLLAGIVIEQYPLNSPSAIVAVRMEAITEGIRLTLDPSVKPSKFLNAHISQ